MRRITLPKSGELLGAYAEGYFPMPSPDNGEILWFRPDPRAIVPLNGFHLSKSLAKFIRQAHFSVTYDTAFSEVMEACSQRAETWITPEFKRAYTELHQLGYAHSVEVWSLEKELIGGLYGVHIRGAFMAESKFHRRTNASKVALYFLVEKLRAQGFKLLEVQFLTAHLASLGAKEVSDLKYQQLLQQALLIDAKFK